MSDFYRPDDTSAWRQEVASRVDTYRARRGRPRRPRDSSLQLDFASPNSWERSAAVEELAPEAVPTGHAPESSAAPLEQAQNLVAAPPVPREVPPRPRRERPRNIIEFPTAGRLFDELAEPIVETPRILDVPETEVAPPALGGITLESAPPPEPFEVPLQPAPLGLRALAGLLDALCVSAAAGVFAWVAVQMSVSLPHTRAATLAVLAIAGLIWAGYQYVFLVYSGLTPGKRLFGLTLATFDGEPVNRSLRRQRALASLLSWAPLGLGVLWSVVDEDTLCWHDRITRTCVTTPEAIEPSR